MQYPMEAKRQLNNPKCYKPIDNSIWSQTTIRYIIQDLYFRKAIYTKQCNFLCGPGDPDDRLFYLLP